MTCCNDWIRPRPSAPARSCARRSPRTAAERESGSTPVPGSSPRGAVDGSVRVSSRQRNRAIMQIRAHAIRQKGGKAEPFLYETVLGRHDALVRITHCSIARGDIQYMDDDWGDTRFPLVAGHEIVGIVAEVGADVAGLRRGDRAGIGYQQEACFECSFCRQGTEQFCPG